MTKSTCAGPECKRPAHSKGLCSTHYKQLAKGKGLTPTRLYGLTLEQRVDACTDKSGECWEWTGAKFPTGYGAVHIDGVVRRAHRITYEMANGPIPDSLFLDHICRNRGCVNPGHLRAVTPKQNSEHLPAESKGSSRYRGVAWHERNKKWQALVQTGGKTYYCGCYSTQEAAHEAVKAKRNELFTHNDLDRL